MNIFPALWLALGAATMAALWVAIRAETRTAALLAAAERDENTDPPEDVMSDDGQHQAEWDEHVTTDLDVTRADDEAARTAVTAAGLKRYMRDCGWRETRQVPGGSMWAKDGTELSVPHEDAPARLQEAVERFAQASGWSANGMAAAVTSYAHTVASYEARGCGCTPLEPCRKHRDREAAVLDGGALERAVTEAAGIAAVAAAGHRAWGLHHAPGDETGRAA